MNDDTTQPPSTYAIDDLVKGRPGGLFRTVTLTALRTAIIYPGVSLAGVPRPWKTSVYASISITLGMMLLESLEARRAPRSLPLEGPGDGLLPLLVALPGVPPL